MDVAPMSLVVHFMQRIHSRKDMPDSALRQSRYRYCERVSLGGVGLSFRIA